MPRIVLRVALAAVAVTGAAFFLGRMAFIRNVNYEIAGVSVPAKHNLLTGSITPVSDHEGKGTLPTLRPGTVNIGLTDGETAAAKIRWAVFERWASSKEEFAGWESNPDIFRKANEDFRKEMQKRGPRITVME